MGRIVKTLVGKELSDKGNGVLGGFNHREHRSKKGRKKRFRDYFFAKDFKRKKEEMKKKGD